MLGDRGVGAELGVLDGQHARDLWRLARPRLLHLVDLWNQLHEPMRMGHVIRLEPETQLRSVRTILRPQLDAGEVILHECDTVEWLQRQPAASLDWVYIDSDHSYEHVARELFEAGRVVKPGGWVCGHDYCPTTPGVMRAVDEWLAANGLRLDVLTDEEPHPVKGGGVAAFLSYGVRLPQ
jgi:hypothetical protein